MTQERAAIRSDAALAKAVRQGVDAVTITDIHTHLQPPSHQGQLLWGIDDLLTYHYLLAEMFAVAPAELTPRRFFALPKSGQADLVWKHLFVERSPLSEAARGVLLTLEKLGLDVSKRDLAAYRRWFAQQKIDTHLPRILDLAGVDYAVMTNDPLAPREAACWQRRLSVPQRLKTALRIDTLVLDWPAAAREMTQQGYRVSRQGPGSFAQARRFLADWAKVLRPLYLAASLPDTFAYPDGDIAKALDKVVLPSARELGLPVALMIGVRRQVNPALGLAGDAMGVCDLQAVQHLCQTHPDVKFLVTVLSRGNQHELCVTARKFANLHVFGCWWFVNQGSIVEEITRMRVEMLGLGFTAQHSDARVLDQLLYKWAEARRIVADVLCDKYRLLLATGWRPTTEEIRRDARRLLGGAFEEFLAK